MEASNRALFWDKTRTFDRSSICPLTRDRFGGMTRGIEGRRTGST